MGPIECPKCGGRLIERRIRRISGRDMLDDQGPTWKTKCGDCGKFYGYRPVEVVEPKRRRPAREELIWE